MCSAVRQPLALRAVLPDLNCTDIQHVARSMATNRKLRWVPSAICGRHFTSMCSKHISRSFTMMAFCAGVSLCKNWTRNPL